MQESGRQQTVLIVDDKPENIRILTAVLKGKYKQMAATSGQSALEIAFSQNKPDLILLDVMMPGIDGYEVCRRLKAESQTRDIPVIFITAMSEVEDEAKGFQLGAVDYITKPFNATIVDVRVRTHLELREKTEIIMREREELAKAHKQLSDAMATLQADIRMAAEVQAAMIPLRKEHPFAESVSIVARYQPEMYVGGDFFDFQRLDEDHLGIMLADVSGHGLQAAFVTGLIKTAFELSGEDRLRPQEFCAKLNQILCELTPPASFATLIYCVYNVRDRSLKYLNAGHSPLPILSVPRQGAGPVSRESNIVMGVIDPVGLESQTFQISPGVKLLLATDGLVDARNAAGEQFGFDRLLALADRHADGSAKELDKAVFDELDKFAGSTAQSDDIAVVTVEFR